ncbi:hypothetical protein [Guptibacillus algicola]|uniref:hypothetical protein n=1 Tax=Guptibacillus algicola TaxID=225844 RepID=UPI001CD7DAE3|nr:hypothetical protein [Alkalihalobacillus algicola]MCA0987495.1 hypothetical protein [Alkalihalobacillus algicola]
MIAEMFKRREKMSYVGLVLLLCFTGVFLAFNMPKTNSEWVEVLALLIPVLFMGFIALNSRKKYKEMKDMEFPQSAFSLLDCNHLILKQDATMTPSLLSFEKDGSFVGMYQLVDIRWWLYPIVLFQSSLLSFFPHKVAFFSNEGEKVFSFRREGIKRTKVTVFDSEDNVIGTYEQEEFKSLVNLKGELKDENGSRILPVKISGFSGDFHLKNEEGKRWAYFYNGRFPHEYTKIFKDMDNDIVEVSDQLSEKNKILLLSLIGFVFMERSQKGN